MKLSPTLKKLLIALGVIVLIAVIYFVVSGQGGTPAPSTSSLSSTTRTNAVTPLNASATTTTGSTLLSLLGRVQTLTLNADIFSNPSFQSLQDFSLSLPAVTSRGRRNPFSPAATTGVQTGVSGNSVQQ